MLLALLAAATETRSFMLTDFDRIRVEGPFRVRVETGKPAAGEAKGGRRGVERVSLRVNGRTLVISASTAGWDGWRDSDDTNAEISVHVPVLRTATLNGAGALHIDGMAAQKAELSMTGAGAITVTNLRADQLDATLIGTGALHLDGTALRARFRSNGAGTIAAEPLMVRDLSVTSQSAGDSSFRASRTAEVTALGVGAVRITGGASCTAAGPGPVSCGD